VQILFLILLVPPEIFWLTQCIDCLKNQRDHRLRWICILLSLNVIGALYYWRLRPQNSMSRNEFDHSLNSWMDTMGFSWKKNENLMKSLAHIGGKTLGLATFVAALRVGVDYFQLPEPLGWFFICLMLALFFWLAVSITKICWIKKDLIIPFFTEFILLAKAGKKGAPPTFGTLKNGPIAAKAVPNLVMADLFLIFAPVFFFGGILHAIGNISGGNSLFGIIMLCAGSLTGLMFLFIAIQINARVIFYYKPDYIFILTNYYRFWKLFVYGVIMTLVIGFGLTFVLLAATQIGA
jgi:hypothetical protein